MKKLVAIALMLTLATPVFAQDYVIKVAIQAPEGSLWMKVLNKLKKTLKKKSNGRLKLRIYAGGVLGDDKVVVSKMRLGQIQAAGLTGVGLGKLVPEIRVMEIPFQISNYKQYDCILPKMVPGFEAKLKEKGFAVLGWAGQGFVYIMSKQKIAKASDMKNTKPWVWEGDPLAAGVFKAFGINPIPLSLQDVFTSLQTGMIDTVYIIPLAAIALQWYTKLKYLVDYPIVNAIGAFVITQKTLDKLPEDLRTLLMKESKKYFRFLGKATRKYNKRSMKTLQKKGLIMLKASAEDQAMFKRKGREAASHLVGKLFSKSLMDQFFNLVEQCAK